MTTTLKMERPTEQTASVRADALDMLLPEVMAWLKTDGDEAGVRKNLEAAVTDCSWDDDGYALAKYLDTRCYWSVDAELVEVLEMWGVYEHRALSKAVKWWVRACNITPQHAVGDVVRAKWGHETIEGTITKICDEEATYVVTKQGDKPGYGAVVKFENVL